AEQVLQWPLEYLARDDDTLNQYRLDLPDLDATLRPDAVLTSPKGEPLLHIVWVDDDPDATLRDTRWPVSAQERFERLLVELQADGGTPMGLVLYPEGVRLCYAPKGEAPGHLTFALEPMLTGDGRLLVDAFVMMLGRARLFTARSD